MAQLPGLWTVALQWTVPSELQEIVTPDNDGHALQTGVVVGVLLLSAVLLRLVAGQRQFRGPADRFAAANNHFARLVLDFALGRRNPNDL